LYERSNPALHDVLNILPHLAKLERPEVLNNDFTIRTSKLRLGRSGCVFALQQASPRPVGSIFAFFTLQTTLIGL
jgi:hypothetical protein